MLLRPRASLVWVRGMAGRPRALPTPSRARDPFLPLAPAQGSVVAPSDPVAVDKAVKARAGSPPLRASRLSHTKKQLTVAPRDGMTVERFLTTIKRGAEEHVDKFQSWDALMTARGHELKAQGVPVKVRKWIMAWAEHYKQGVEPALLPLVSRAKKNKFASRRKPKTREQKKRD